MSSVTLQNNVRLRVILVLLISLLIQFGRHFVSDSVHKATALLEVTYIFYGLLLLCSCIPSKIAWYIAAIVLVMATLVDGTVLALGGLSTLRCLEKSGCIQTMPGNSLVLLLVAMQCLLDLYQTWNVYLILRRPYLIASSTQRLVILFAWAFPFAILTNWILLIESQWTVWVSPPLVAMPIIIIMVQSSEYSLVGLLIAVSIASNAFSYVYVTNTLARSAIIVQGAISLFGTIILFIPSETYVKPPAISPPQPILPVVQKIDSRLRNRKSQNPPSKSKMLHF